MNALVTTDWLAGELGKPDLVVFDATKYLPNEPKDGRAEFLPRTSRVRATSISMRSPTPTPICRTWFPPRAFRQADGRTRRRQRGRAWCFTTRRVLPRRRAAGG
jgi:hypothetical protein